MRNTPSSRSDSRHYNYSTGKDVAYMFRIRQHASILVAHKGSASMHLETAEYKLCNPKTGVLIQNQYTSPITTTRTGAL